MTDRLNNIDVTCFAALQEKIRASDKDAHPVFSTKLTWISGMKSKIALSNSRSIMVDEPEEMSGEDSAPTPEDLLLAAVGSCHAAAWAATLSAKKIRINSLEIETSGAVNFRGTYLADGTPPGFENMTIRVKIDADVDQNVLQKILPEVAAISTIPDTISRAVPLKFELV